MLTCCRLDYSKCELSAAEDLYIQADDQANDALPRGANIEDTDAKENMKKIRNMSRYRQPKSLEDISLSRLADWVAEKAELQMKSVGVLAQRDTSIAQATLTELIGQIRRYLEYNVPWMLYDSLTTETIRSLTELVERIKEALGFRVAMGKFVSQVNIAVSMIEVMFTKNITILSIDTIPKMMRVVFYSKMHMLTGLVYLNLGSLSGGWKTSDMETSIVHALKELHQLKCLTISYDCTDGILKCIVANCTKIEKLDITSSKCVTNESIDIICKLKALRSVQLYRTFVTLEGFAKLLVNRKTLEDIGRCDEIGRVLEYIDLTNSAAPPFNLITYVSRYAPQNQLHLAVQMCPKIRYLTVFHNTLQGDLIVFIGLKDLCELKLLSCDFYADQIKQVLQVKGCNIVHLYLEHVDQIDLNALMYVSQMCPLLESLTLYNCTLIQHTSLYTKKLELLPFRNLKRFTCVATCTNEQLLFVLWNCVNVEFIHVGTAVQLTDDLVLNILDKNPLLHLKELRILQSDFLTMVSIERLLESCMSLEILVELESWTMLSDTDREHVKNYIKTNNLNVDIQPIRRYDA